MMRGFVAPRICVYVILWEMLSTEAEAAAAVAKPRLWVVTYQLLRRKTARMSRYPIRRMVFNLLKKRILL
uniref:Putative secreted protein n=1 Tax=Anopheles triannulatus TaxID=58253 RepID=A0A2M4B7Y9_9DIPT